MRVPITWVRLLTIPPDADVPLRSGLCRACPSSRDWTGLRRQMSALHQRISSSTCVLRRWELACASGARFSCWVRRVIGVCGCVYAPCALLARLVSALSVAAVRLKLCEPHRAGTAEYMPHQVVVGAAPCVHPRARHRKAFAASPRHGARRSSRVAGGDLRRPGDHSSGLQPCSVWLDSEVQRPLAICRSDGM